MFGVPPKPAFAETIVSVYEPPMIVQLRPDCWSSEPENHLDPAPPTVCSGLTAIACAGSSTARTAINTVNAEVSRFTGPSMSQVMRSCHCFCAPSYPERGPAMIAAMTAASDAARASYDALPYPGHAFPQSHPGRMAA